MPRQFRFQAFLLAGFSLSWMASLTVSPLFAQKTVIVPQGGPAAMEQKGKPSQAPPEGGRQAPGGGRQAPEGGKGDDAKNPNGEKKDEKPEGPPPVQRPAQPSRPADPGELDIRP